MNGKLIKMMQQREALIALLTEKEYERITNNTRNVHKYKALYDILYKLDKGIEEELNNGM